MDRWNSLAVVCKGGLVLNQDALTQGQMLTGTARILQNFEPSVAGGYARIKGYSKYSTTELPGSGAVLGIKVALGGVLAARLDGTDNKVHYGTGTTWTLVNSTPRTGSVEKYRFINYSIVAPVVVMCDGANPAAKWDGTTYTLINGTGAPTAPKYAEMILSRLVLAPASNPSSIAISAANTDNDFTAGAGALEINIGDEVMGLKKFRDTLYIFCKNSIWKLVGNSISNFSILPVTDNIGCISQDSIQEIGGDVVFLGTDGIRSLAATERIGDLNLSLISQQIQPLVREYLDGLSEYKFSSLIIRNKNQYRLFVNVGADDLTIYPGFIGMTSTRESGYNYDWGTTRGIASACADSEYSGVNELAVFGAVKTGFVYRLEGANGFDGANIEYNYQSPSFTFDEATLRKVMQKITIYTQVEGNLDTILNVLLDFQNAGIPQPLAIPLSVETTVALYGTGVYGTAVYSGALYPVIKKNLVGAGFTIAFQFSGADSNPPFRIDSYQIEFGMKARR